MKLIILLVLLSSCTLSHEFSIPSGETPDDAHERYTDGHSSKK